MLVKIALVVLGIVGVIVLFKGADYLVELRHRETLDADLKPVLGGLTPEEVIRRCGTPDLQTESDLLFRELSYRRSGVVVKFVRNGPKEVDWMFSSINDSVGRGDTRSALDSLPCLK